jgi:hypothetical protein
MRAGGRGRVELSFAPNLGMRPLPSVSVMLRRSPSGFEVVTNLQRDTFPENPSVRRWTLLESDRVFPSPRQLSQAKHAEVKTRSQFLSTKSSLQGAR